MANLNLKSRKSRTFDAIVIGSGISGGWAAKELCEKGLKTLVIERGRDVKHVSDYPTAMKNAWEFEHRGQIPLKIREEYKVPSEHYIFGESTLHFLVKDKEQEYIQEDPFTWMRGYQVGGRSLLWARQTQRWSDFDFEGPARDGFAVDWPIRYADIAPWYSYVEKFAGISGNLDGLPHLPDGEFLPPHEMTCVEKHFSHKVSEKYPGRHVIIGRVAHLTEPQDIHYRQGRAKCQHRTICERGCPYGGYFSTNSSTLPWAERTGNLTLRTHALAHSVMYDDKKAKATGVKIIDTVSGEESEYFADLIFVNGSALNTNLILLNSKSNRFPEGLGNDHDILGRYIAFHTYRGRISAEYDGYLDFTTEGKRPNAAYIPRFRNVFSQETDFLRGYAAGFSTSRANVQNTDGLGDLLKQNLSSKSWGNWTVGSHMMGETIPKHESRVKLDPVLKDKYGLPQLRVSVKFDDNDDKMLRDFHGQFEEMYTYAGFKNIRLIDTQRMPGSENHEMGGVRMGHEAKTSMLNKWNQLHACKNVFVTDGACMTSTATQNPSLSYMALTARAVDYAVAERKKKNL